VWLAATPNPHRPASSNVRADRREAALRTTHRPPPGWRLEELEVREVPSVEGLDIPAGHTLPRLWFTPERLAQARAWYAAHPFAPEANRPLDNAFVYQMTGDTTVAARAVADLLNFTVSNTELNATQSNAYRWGDWVPVVFDWCFNQMTPDQRTAVTTRYNFYTDTIMGKIWGGPGFFSNNYYWGYWRNALNWGIATYGDNPKAETYIHDALANRWTNNFVPWAAGKGAGGVSLEGTMYGREVLQYPTIPLQSSILLGRDLLTETNYYTEAVYNLIYSTSPGPLAAPGEGSFYQVFPFNDDQNSHGFPVASHSDYADFMTIMAGEYSDRHVGGIARQWLSTVAANPHYYVAAVDRGGATRSLSSLPTDYYAPGPGYLYAKSDWSPAAMSLGFQLGWVFDGGVGHGHRDAGSFQISRNGQWLTKESTGYTGDIVGYKGTGTAWVGSELAHNGLLFQGKGLVEQQYANGSPRVTRLESTPEYTFASVDLTPAFRTNNDPYAGPYDNPYARSVVRDFVYVRELGALIAFDRMESRSGAMPAEAVEKTFLLHFPNNPTISGNTVLGVNGDQALKLTALTPTGQSPPVFRVVNEIPATTISSTDYQYRLEATTTGMAQTYLINVIQAREATAADLVISMTEDAAGFAITLRDPTTGKTAVVKLDKGMSSAGGSFGFSAVGTPTSFPALASGVQPIQVTADGVTWGASNPSPRFQVSTPASIGAGSSFNVTVTAKTAAGTTDLGYRGTVRLTSSDGQAVLPADYAFTAADAGTHTFPIILKTAGARTLVVSDISASALSGQGIVSISPAAAAVFEINGRPSATPGAPQSLTVTARDAYWNRVTGYAGTVHFRSTDVQAALPADYTFGAADKGTHVFSATLNTAGMRSISVSDAASASILGNAAITVTGSDYSLWRDSDSPATAAWDDPQPQEIGVRFSSKLAGYVTGLRFYKGPGNTGTHVGHLWASDGTLLAEATFTNEGAAGWQQVSFSNPVAIAANVPYVVSYYAPTGRYAFTRDFFASAGVSNGPLQASADGVNGGNGLYRYGIGGGFPTNTYCAGNYWVDPIVNVPGFDTTPPAITSITPAQAATGVPRFTNASATFSEPVQPNTIGFVLRDSAGTAVSATVSYDADTRTATLTPTAPLQWGTSYTATLSSVRDPAGNVMSPVSWSFTTQMTAVGQPFAVGTGAGRSGLVTLYNADRSVRFTVTPFGTGYTGGVRVATGDVTGDGVQDVAAVTAGGITAQGLVINGATGSILANQLLGPTTYTGPVSVAMGDVNGDRIADIAFGTDENGPRAQVIRGGDFRKIADISGLASDFRGGTQIGIGDMTGDGRAELVVTATYSNGSLVFGYTGASLVPGMTASPAFTPFTLSGGYVDGLFLAVGDVSGDGRADLVLGTPASATPQVNVYSGYSLAQDDSRSTIATFTPTTASSGTGVRVAARDIDGDGILDILASSGERVSAYRGGNLSIAENPPTLFDFDPDPAVSGDFWIG
jgi:Domain of unknown function (DUF4082)/Bacterial Ig-like domain/FG-GAP-like repeat/FG-GAP repeat